MDKKEARLQKIMEIHQADPGKSQEEIRQVLDVSPRTIKADYKELKRRGNIIGYKMKEEKTKPEESSGLPELPFNKKAVQAIMFLCGIGGGGKTIDEIAEKRNEEYIASRSTIFRSLIPYLKSNGLLKKEKGFLAPVAIYMTTLPEDYTEILNFAAYSLAKYIDGAEIVYKMVLRYLYDKKMIFSSKQDSMLEELPSYIQTLKRNCADKVPVSFKYKGRTVHFFYLGFVAYSSDKDAVYLVGRTKPTRMDDTYSIFKADEIDWETMVTVNDKNFENALIDRNKNMRNRMECFSRKLQAEMFDAVDDRLWSVSVRVKYSVNVEYELQKLFDCRRKQWEAFDKAVASLRVSKEEKSHNLPYLRYLDKDAGKIDRHNPDRPVEYIEYSDDIRGIANFANYLRRFGDTVEVTKCEELQKIMKNGAERALKHYKG